MIVKYVLFKMKLSREIFSYWRDPNAKRGVDRLIAMRYDIPEKRLTVCPHKEGRS